MPLEPLACVYDPPTDANADWIVRNPRAIFVIDGASSLQGEKIEGLSSAAWLARRLGESLSRFEGGNIEAYLRTELPAIAARAALPGAGSGEEDPPFCCLIGCIEHEDVIEIVSWGDCQAIVRAGDGSSAELFGFCSVVLLDDAVTEAVYAAKRNGASHQSAFEQSFDQIKANRQRRNVDPGYQILDLRPPYVGIPERRFLDKRLPWRILLTSDGLFRATACYGMTGVEELAAIERQDELDSLLADMRALESSDPGGDQHHRLKPSDDVAAIVVAFRPDIADG